jgi:hypothetical protein
VQGTIPDFDHSVQVMLGGDEVFVAAHPYFSRYVADIIGDLDKTQFKSDSHGRDIGSRFLNMRVSVAFSSAKKVQAGVSNDGVSAAQKLENQIAHDKAMKLSGNAAGALKRLERTQRRIERLIDMLLANEKKKKLAPPFTDRLTKLGIMRVFARVQYAHVGPISTRDYAALVSLLEQEDIVGAQKTKLVELVDFDGNIVDAKKLTDDAAKLEADVRAAVGRDNYHMSSLLKECFLRFISRDYAVRLWRSIERILDQRVERTPFLDINAQLSVSVLQTN